MNSRWWSEIIADNKLASSWELSGARSKSAMSSRSTKFAHHSLSSVTLAPISIGSNLARSHICDALRRKWSRTTLSLYIYCIDRTLNIHLHLHISYKNLRRGYWSSRKSLISRGADRKQTLTQTQPYNPNLTEYELNCRTTRHLKNLTDLWWALIGIQVVSLAIHFTFKLL